MRYLIGLISIIGVATGIWMLQPTDGTADPTDHGRTPVVRITEIPLPIESAAHIGVPSSEQDTAESKPDHVTVDPDSVRFIPVDEASAGSSVSAPVQVPVGALGGSFSPLPQEGYVDQVVALE